MEILAAIFNFFLSVFVILFIIGTVLALAWAFLSGIPFIKDKLVVVKDNTMDFTFLSKIIIMSAILCSIYIPSKRAYAHFAAESLYEIPPIIQGDFSDDEGRFIVSISSQNLRIKDSDYEEDFTTIKNCDYFSYGKTSIVAYNKKKPNSFFHRLNGTAQTVFVIEQSDLSLWDLILSIDDLKIRLIKQ